MNIQRLRIVLIILVLAIIASLVIISYAARGVAPASYLPVVNKSLVEMRALWVTRYDWDEDPTPAKIDEIVQNAAAAGFNAIFFQVRGEADAFYTPGLEPWSRLLTGKLGLDPGWDPLLTMIDKAHQEGIQVHAYVNVYPIWLGCGVPQQAAGPTHLYFLMDTMHGIEDGKQRGVQWDQSNNLTCISGDYRRATPASVAFDNHILAVVTDMVNRYDLDGIHLDHIRYANGASCDPVSLCVYNGYSPDCQVNLSCNMTTSYRDWQRRQVNGTVRKFYERIVPLKPGLWLSAAVWPIYQTGYSTYHQDSLAWTESGTIDSISPMIYLPFADTAVKWKGVVEGFQDDSRRNGRFIIPGISGADDNFSGIAERIEAARQLETAGHAIFSYGALNERSYFDDLANGPYSVPAAIPKITWHP